MPPFELVSPMLAAAGPLPRGCDWAYEMKYDGVRSIAYVQDGEVRLYSRNANDIITSHYPELQELGMLLDGRDAVLDGEIVAPEPGDRPSFSRLQARMHVARGTGFADIALRQLQQQLGPLERATPPVPDVLREHARRAIWVEPVLVGEVEFRNWTPENRLRHPSWRGLRPDRSPSSVHRAPMPVVSPPPDEVEGALHTLDVLAEAGIEHERSDRGGGD